jgi:DNA-binding NtrC family response regulator
MKKSNNRILIIDDDEDVLLAAKLLLKQHFNIVETEKDPRVIPDLLNNEIYDVILLDMNFTQDMTSGQEGFYWLNEILKIDTSTVVILITSSTVVILITSFGDVDTAVKAIKFGASDFVLKPWQNEKFIATISSALRLSESRRELDYLRSQNRQLNQDSGKKFRNIIGNSAPMQRVFNTIHKVANTDANILIMGENGTGKELIARALHNQSLRSSEIFVSVDMGAISHSLFESELFGHVRGAFTDAKEDRAGRFELASKGTLFLDEISNIPIELQAKLLSAIQDRKITRVGSNKEKEINIRLICATNSDLNNLVNDDRFRQDLLYRINTVEIQIPPLRVRKADIELLVEYYLNIYRKKYNKPNIRLVSSTLSKLKNYEWPGNVRELQHMVERAVILCESDILQPHDFVLRDTEISISEMQFDNYNLESVEKTIIRKVLAQCEGNVTKAAEELGLTRTSLYRRMIKFNL